MRVWRGGAGLDTHQGGAGRHLTRSGRPARPLARTPGLTSFQAGVLSRTPVRTCALTRGPTATRETRATGGPRTLYRTRGPARTQ